jgi:D-alanyl-D-alanine carboxypeptidase
LRALILFIAFVFIGLQSYSQIATVQFAAYLQNILDSSRIANNVVGASATVIFEDKSEWNSASGISATAVPLTPQMLMGIGSNTKTFVSTVMLQLQEENTVNIDDSLFTYLPTYPNIDSNITIRQLLNHTSGIFNYSNSVAIQDTIANNLTKIFTPAEILTYVEAPSFPAGTSWEYSNTNYILAGMIIETVTGNNIIDEIRSRILTPLNMDSTYMEITETSTLLEAHPWNLGVDVDFIPREALSSSSWSAGAIKSNAHEMATFNNELLTGNLLTPASLAEMQTFVSNYYGLGLSQIFNFSSTQWGHGGLVFGFSSYALYDTSYHTTVVVLTNQTEDYAKDIALDLLQRIIDYLPPLAVEELSAKKTIKVFPTIVTDKINVVQQGRQALSYQIIDLTGKIVQSGIVNEQTIGFKGINKGLYFLKLMKENSSTIQIDRFIVY